MPVNPVAWFEIYVDDLPRAKAFYEVVFAVELEKLSDPTDGGLQMLVFPTNMDEYGVTGALVKMEGVAAGGNSTLVYFSSQDCSVEESRVAAAGGEVQRGKMPIGEHGFISLASDTEGNMFGIYSQK